MMRLTLIAAVGLAFTAFGCKTNPNQRLAYFAGKALPQQSVRKPHWAQPVHMEGVPNMYQVTPLFYRGSQPSDDGWKTLKTLGVRTVVTVRWLHSGADLVQRNSMRHEWIRMKAWEPTDDQMVQFLKLLNDPNRTPIFVQCYTGSDRAGLLTAVYRITMCGWSKEESIEEMLTGGYDFHEILQDIYLRYLQNMDPEKLRRQAGLVGYIVDKPNGLKTAAVGK